MLRGLPLVFVAFAALAADLELIAPQPLSVDSAGNATATLTLRNTSAKPVALDLAVSDFQSGRSGKSYALGAVSTLTPATGNLPAGGTQSVKLTAAKIWEAGVSMAVLRNAGAAIPTITATRANQ